MASSSNDSSTLSSTTAPSSRAAPLARTARLERDLDIEYTGTMRGESRSLPQHFLLKALKLKYGTYSFSAVQRLGIIVSVARSNTVAATSLPTLPRTLMRQFEDGSHSRFRETKRRSIVSGLRGRL